jgi:NAD(P)-dependent dehydrogenase (short-subunit alcohol dehydrogenase family)
VSGALEGQTVLVVGASSGIGRATAEAASREGAHLLLASRSAERLEEVRAGLTGDATILAFDFRDREQVRAALAPFGRIDHVVTPAVADENARRGRFVELDDATMRASFDKFWGQLHVTQAAAPLIPAGGSVTLFSSIAGLWPPGPASGLSVMNAVQAAVMALGRSLALELAPVRVNVMVPGVVLTGVWAAAEHGRLEQWMEGTLPAHHAGRPEDVARAALYLMTSPYVTGTLHVIDGGAHLL